MAVVIAIDDGELEALSTKEVNGTCGDSSGDIDRDGARPREVSEVSGRSTCRSEPLQPDKGQQFNIRQVLKFSPDLVHGYAELSFVERTHGGVEEGLSRQLYCGGQDVLGTILPDRTEGILYQGGNAV